MSLRLNFFLTTNSLSWEDTELAKLIKERVFQFILTFLDEEHALFSSGVGVILGVSYLTPALVKYRYWHAQCVDSNSFTNAREGANVVDMTKQFNLKSKLFISSYRNVYLYRKPAASSIYAARFNNWRAINFCNLEINVQKHTSLTQTSSGTYSFSDRSNSDPKR